MGEKRPFALLEDVELLFRRLTDEEARRCVALLPLISDLLRQAARNLNRDLDEMIETGRLSPAVAKAVTVDVAARVLRQSTTGEPMTQESQSAMGYQWQGTYAIPGGGVAAAIMNNDLKRLGLVKKQRFGVIGLYDPSEGSTG